MDEGKEGKGKNKTQENTKKDGDVDGETMKEGKETWSENRRWKIIVHLNKV